SKELNPYKHIIRKVNEADLNNTHPERCIKATFKSAVADMKLPSNIDKVYVSVNNEHIVSVTEKMHEVFDKKTIISESIINDLNNISLDKNEAIIYLDTNKYVIDNKTEVINPLLMEANSIEAHNFVVKIDDQYLDIIDEILDEAGLKAEYIFPGSVAQAEVILSSQEKNLGSALIDIGYSTTDVAVYENGKANLCFSLNLGIGDIIEALSRYLELKYKDAYYIFKEYANLMQTESQSQISYIDIYGDKKMIDAGILNKIIEDIFKQIFKTLNDIFKNNNRKIHALAFSGGITHIQGIRNLANQCFDANRVRISKQIENKTELSENKWSTCFGLIVLAKINNINKQKSFDILSIFYNIKNFIEKILK
ncbi:MAG: ethanolamine ammonia-lyase reactivating factor EutA, partial [Armatimonadetes bacterium]|nr:ethanolamine ammonia-lyase reactivating factor EutA [Candidatus Hippobium faecium]